MAVASSLALGEPPVGDAALLVLRLPLLALPFQVLIEGQRRLHFSVRVRFAQRVRQTLVCLLVLGLLLSDFLLDGIGV